MIWTLGSCKLHRLSVLLLAAVCAGACSFPSEPERALEAYVYAVNEGRCDDALELLSTRSRHGLDVLRVKPQHPQNPLPIEEYYCRKLIFEDCKWGEMQLDESYGNAAKVSMPCGKTQDSFLPGFSSIFLKYEPRVTELMLEDGRWRVVVPRVIRIAEIREKEDRMLESALERDQELRKARGLPPAAPVKPRP